MRWPTRRDLVTERWLCLGLVSVALGATAIAVVRHHARWIVPESADGLVAFDGFLQMLAAPGWLFGLKLLGAGIVRSLPFALVVYGVCYLCIATTLPAMRIVWRCVIERCSRTAAEDSIDLGRRGLLKRLPEAAFVGGLGGVGYATVIEPWALRVRDVRVEIPGLCLEHDGLRVLQLTDLHLGPRIPASFLEQVVRHAAAQQPDLVVLTGDYIHNFAEQAEPVATLLRPLVAAAPTVGVLGNHDWYGGGAPVRAALERIGVRMVDNTRCVLDQNRRITDGGDGLVLAGVGDLYEDTVDFDSALAGIDSAVPRLLLSHNPDVAELPELARYRVDLMLSGHTHGGQIRLPVIGAPGVPSRYGQKYAQGLVRGPNCLVHVSAGVGMSIAPVRLGVPPEINLLTLCAV